MRARDTRLVRTLRERATVRLGAGAYPPGHYYSPVPDVAELGSEPHRSRIWPSNPRDTPGIDWRDDAQVALCRDVFAAQERLVLAEEPSGDPIEYVASSRHNWFFWPLDAWILEAMLRHLRPRRMIEIGSGFSSLITARVNREFFDGDMRFTAIEPYPRDFLVQGVSGITELRTERVQDTPLTVFEELEEGDVLFIDTSHAVKTGGDLPWIYNQVVPRVAPGVVVHIHDVFLPNDYHREWVLEGYGWNEAYLVQAFLTFNSAFKILFAAEWMLQHHRGELMEAFPGYAEYDVPDPLPAGTSPGESGSSGSLWLRRVPSATV